MKMQQAVGAGHFHAVRFYESPEALARIVSDFISEGVAFGLPGVLIATPTHLALIEAHLEGRGFHVDLLKATDTLIVVDAVKHLSQIMVDDMPDAQRFRAATLPVLERACKGRGNCVIRAYGEMVDVLWQAGRVVAATKLEMLWNELAATHDFALLCGYAMGHFYKDATKSDIYHLHSHVIGAAGEPLPLHSGN